MPSLDSHSSAVPGKALVAGAVGVAGAAALVLGVRRVLAGRADALLALPPATDSSQWRRVGRLEGLYCYPLKSAGPVVADALEATETGLRSGVLRDRVFLAVDRDGNFLTGRSHPRLVLVSSSVVQGEAIAFSYPDEDGQAWKANNTLVVDPAKLGGGPARKIRVWKTTVSGVDCGDAAAAWLRRAVVDKAVHGEATAAADLRLVYYPYSDSDRTGIAGPSTPGIYTDEASFSLLNEGSLADLNGRLARPVPLRNFRPNFFVKGPEAFAEDGWRWIRIGEQAIFKLHMPCGRCMMTTIDSETGTKSSDFEPLTTLRKYRKPTPEQRKLMGSDAPVLGLSIKLHQRGPVSVGDEVYAAA